MSRRHLTFACEGSHLAATLDEGGATTGLLMVSGGNEIRSGAWNGQAQFAARIAVQGYPVFRFDRRGIGDSEGTNGEFRASGPDIAAALGAFREQAPHVTRVVGFGNCDAASALMLNSGGGCDALVLSSPWTFEDGSEEAPPEAVRAHYRQRLADPAAIRRLVTGKVSLRGLVSSLIGALRSATPPGSLVRDMAAGLASFTGPVVLLAAGRDRTGQAFLAAWNKADPRLQICPGATHSYVEADARDWLAERVLDALRS